PVTRMLQSERERLLHLEDELHKRVVGQDEAISVIANAVRRSRAGLSDGKRPIGSFIFLGTTGVGKTELAKALAEFLFNDENMMTRIDMSEYQERHTVSRLVGAPPGYVGYDEGGQLTEAVRRKPYSVVLLDEIEKAHPDVFNVLLQVLDDGRLTDNKGRTVDFKNTILVMTSNVGSDIIQGYMEKLPEVTGIDMEALSRRRAMLEECKGKVLDVLKMTVRPEFLNRIDEVIMFDPLTKTDIRDILHIQMEELRGKLADSNVEIRFTPAFEDLMVEKGYDPVYGARPVKRVMQKELVNLLAKSILDGSVRKDSVITVDAAGGEIVLRNQ
ncbi:MAG: AAA family ATPase, partial [Bacteroidales bacterium]|nr:AAA family ATPase [Bacteroidales bacterium]